MFGIKHANITWFFSHLYFYKTRLLLASFGLFSSSNQSAIQDQVSSSSFLHYDMSGDDSFGNLHSSSQDALNALVNEGIKQDAAEWLLQLIPGQSPRWRERDAEQSSVEWNSDGRASFESRMMEMMEGFSWRLSDLAARVFSTHEAAANGGTSTEAPPPPSTSRALDWVDRPLDQLLDTLPPIQWPNEETETSGNLVEVSEETTTFLRSCFWKSLTNAARHSLKKPIDVPKVDGTKCPKLDRVVKDSLKAQRKPTAHWQSCRRSYWMLWHL